MCKKYYIIRILERRLYDLKVTYSLPTPIEVKLTKNHPCLVCKLTDNGVRQTVFCVLAESPTEAEAKLTDYITVPVRRIFK